MKASQITAALIDEDHDAIAKLTQALRAADDTEILGLLEDIRHAIRKDTVTDVLTDLEDAGEDSARDFIEANY